MPGSLGEKLKEIQRNSRGRYCHDMVDPLERKKQQYYRDWVDHGILLYRWHNLSEVAQGKYRPKPPTPRTLSASIATY